MKKRLPGSRARRSPPPRPDLRAPRAPKWAWHRRALLSLRRRLLHEQLEQMCDSLQRTVAGPGEPVADRDAESDFTLALLAHEEDALREITDAIDRIDHGTYGLCAVTGLPIPAARLRAVPWTRQLRDVAQRREELRRPGP